MNENFFGPPVPDIPADLENNNSTQETEPSSVEESPELENIQELPPEETNKAADEGFVEKKGLKAEKPQPRFHQPGTNNQSGGPVK